MTFDPNPSLEIQQQIVANKIEAMKQQYFDIGLEITMAESQELPTEGARKEVARTLEQMRFKQKNAARAAERMQGEYNFISAQLADQAELNGSSGSAAPSIGGGIHSNAPLIPE